MLERYFAGDNGNVKSQIKWPLLASQVDQYTTSNGVVAGEDGDVLWSGRWWARPLDTRKNIFCNRSLNMKSIVAIGFDMDYTLAQYKADTFESLAYAGTIQKLVNNLSYPPEVGFFSLRLVFMNSWCSAPCLGNSSAILVSFGCFLPENRGESRITVHQICSNTTDMNIFCS